jgi:hypothetical protein
MEDLKAEVYKLCMELLHSKKLNLSALLSDLEINLLDETKSSAGDKHETSRAMLHLEMEKINTQLQHTNEEIKNLEQININAFDDKIRSGSLVETDRGYFFISVSLGKISYDGKSVYAISPLSPLFKMLSGKSKGEVININNVSYKIIKVY